MPEEQTVTTEAPETAPAETSAPKSFREHFEAAKAAQSTDKGTTAASDDTSTTETAEDPEKPADQPEDTGDVTDAILTPEELNALPPKERANAEKWQAKLTQKAQALAAQGKEYEPWKPLIDAFKADPEQAIMQLAKERGYQVTKAGQDTTAVTAKSDDMIKELPEELQFLKPVFEAYKKQVLSDVRGELEPIQQAHTQMAQEAITKETDATLKAFGAKHPGWEKHEARMIELGKKILPGEGATDFEYTEMLYTLATAGITEAERTKKVVEKINKSAASVEPSNPGVSEKRVEHAMPPPERRSIREAFEAAKRGERWVK